MSAVTALIKKHPVPAYFALAFAISWGGVLVVVGPGGIPGIPEQNATLFPFAYLAMLAGPSVAGLLLTGLVHGRAGFRELRSRLLTWRVGARWYAIALLTAPLVATTVLLGLSLADPIFLPGIITSDDKAFILLFGLAVGLGAGFFEELGWTGFAIPALRKRYGVLATGFITGALWGAWHFLVNVWASSTSVGSLSLSLFLPGILVGLLAGTLPAFRVLMVWVYERTGSLLVAMLMHVSLTSSLIIFRPPAALGVSLLVYDLVLAAALWVVVAVVAASGQFSREPRA
jgi:membrane protease YdiL (CAAX protease family)